jgi:hypothetical protein
MPSCFCFQSSESSFLNRYSINKNVLEGDTDMLEWIYGTGI